jgi:hypothetical protein
MASEQQTSSHDPFTQFWTDLASRMGMAAQPAPPAAGDAMKQMQRVFLDALAKYCDDFMRSPVFLEMMRQHMTNALSFQQQVNQFLTHAQRSAQPGAAAESADLVEMVRGLRDQVERLERKVSAAGGSAKRRTASTASRTLKSASSSKSRKSRRSKK